MQESVSMTNPDTVFHLARHFDFFDESIVWSQKSAQRRALLILCEELIESRGFHIPLGRKRLIEDYGQSAGEASATLVALRELRDRHVVDQRVALGRSNSYWSLTTDVARWRGINWTISGRHARSLFLACDCVSACALASQFPDQSANLRLNLSKMRILEKDGTFSSGLSLVELRRFRARRDETNTESSGKVVELRRNGHGIDDVFATSPYIPSSINRTLLEQEREDKINLVMTAAVRAMRRPGNKGKIFGEPRRIFDELVGSWTLEQCEQAVLWLDESNAKGLTQNDGAVAIVDRLAGMVKSPAWPKGHSEAS